VYLDHTFAGEWVTLTNPLAPFNNRLQSTPDMAPGDIVAWGGIEGTGTVDVLPDGSFEASATVTAFWFEVWDGTGWGTKGTQSFVIDPDVQVSSVKYQGSWRKIGDIEVFQQGVWDPVYAGYVRENGLWKKIYPSENLSPTVTITAPLSGSLISGTTTVTAKAIDDVGIQDVKFYLGYADTGIPPVLLGTVTTPPYSVTFNAGSYANASGYRLWAVATDTTALSTTSATSTVTIDTNLPPIVEINAPANGAVVWQDYAVAVTASDPNPTGSIASVKLYENGVLLGTDTVAPYSFNITTGAKPNGTYTYVAEATDNLGAKSFSASRNVTVYKYGAPALTNPSSGGLVWDGATQNFWSHWYVSTTGFTGNMYWVISLSSTAPTPTQISQGRDSSGVAAVRSGNYPINQPGNYMHTTYNLPTNATVYMYWAHIDERGQQSNVASASVVVPSNLTLSVNPTTVTGTTTNTVSFEISQNVVATTSNLTYTTTGASGNSTIAIVFQSGVEATVIHDPVARTVAFRRSVLVEPGATVVRTGTYRIRVTDSLGRTTESPNLTATTTHRLLYDGGGQIPI
jgi:hypothetical protein